MFFVRMSALAAVSGVLILFSGAVMVVLAWPLTTSWQVIPVGYLVALGCAPVIVAARSHGGTRSDVVRKVLWCWLALSAAVLPVALVAFAM